MRILITAGQAGQTVTAMIYEHVMRLRTARLPPRACGHL
jgi:hypothetical protein